MSTNTPGIRGGSVKVIVAVIAGLILVVVIYGALRSQPAQTLASRVKTLEDMDGSRDRLIAAQQIVYDFGTDAIWESYGDASHLGSGEAYVVVVSYEMGDLRFEHRVRQLADEGFFWARVLLPRSGGPDPEKVLP